MSESFEEELKKLQLNLENAEKTYGKSSSPCRIIQRIIDDFTAKREISGDGPSPAESLQNSLQLPFRPKTSRS